MATPIIMVKISVIVVKGIVTHSSAVFLYNRIQLLDLEKIDVAF
jgi:hypothetical protein